MIIDFIALFILLSGCIIGLGAVTVIDIHGFLARKSSYWTEATIRTHKITKPMIWTGIILAIIGGSIFFRHEDFVGVPLYLFIIAIVLVVNGLFLSLYVSPYLIQKEKEGRSTELLPQSWQNLIMISLIFSDIGWWTSIVLISYFLVL